MVAPSQLVLDTSASIQVNRWPSGIGPGAAIGAALQPLLSGATGDCPVDAMATGRGDQISAVVSFGRFVFAAVSWDGFFGSNVGHALVRYDPNTATWSFIGGLIFGSNTFRADAGGGIYTLLDGTGKQILAGFYYQDLSGFQSYTYWRHDPATGSYVTGLLAPSAAGAIGRTIVYRNTIYAMANNAANNSIWALNPVAVTATQYNVFGGTGSMVGAFCVFNDRLFCIKMATTATPMRLYEFSGGTWVNKGTLTGAAAASNATIYTEATPVLFAVGSTKMVAIYVHFDGVNYGTKACDIPNPDSTGTWSDVTSTLIPAGLQPSASVAKADDFWTAFTDNDTTPGSPAIYLWHGSIFNSGSYSYYEYVSSASTLGPGTAAGSCQVRFPGMTTGGGDRIAYDNTVPDTDLVAVQTATPAGILGGVRLSFRVAGGTNGNAGRRTDVNLATIAALPAYTWNSPTAGPGATLTANANGALSVDGVPVSVGNRVLVKDEATQARNGIYSVSAAGDGSNPFVLLRATDFDQASSTEVAAGAWCRVLSGSLANTYWQMSQTAAITMDTTALTWLQLATRYARVFYNAQYNSTMAQGTLMGTPTGLPWVTRNVDVIEGIIADDNTVYTMDWSIGAGPNTYVIRIGVS